MDSELGFIIFFGGLLVFGAIANVAISRHSADTTDNTASEAGSSVTKKNSKSKDLDSDGDSF